MFAHLLRANLSELHVVAHTLRRRIFLCTTQHLAGEVAQQNLMALGSKSAGDLADTAAGIQY